MTQGTRAQQRDRTRAALLEASRRLFASHGYSAVSLDAIVGKAGVTKGALYHHFTGGKIDVFRAVLAQVQAEVAQQVAAAAEGEVDPWEQLISGCRAFLTASTEPTVRRIMLVDGPAVLGWSEWRAMDEAGSASHLGESLSGLIDSGVISPQPVAPLTRLLSGAMNEAALWLAETGDPVDLQDVLAALSRLLAALRR